MKDTMIGVDLAKRVFQVHVASMTGQVRFLKKLTREHSGDSWTINLPVLSSSRPAAARKAYTTIAAKMARTVHAIVKSGEPHSPFFKWTVHGGRTLFS
ncbi:hypothetical protein [uncultured Limimaricola sp.]|uniref:hypothetical protein n=1 Tax=uncultured Limimaricola sp. TaxID=2211667 RepID=UPI0030FC85C1